MYVEKNVDEVGRRCRVSEVFAVELAKDYRYVGNPEEAILLLNQR